MTAGADRRAMLGLAALAGVFIIVAALAVADVGGDNRTYTPNESDLIGQWYLVDCQGYSSAGSYVTISAGDDRCAAYGLTVYDVTDGLFYGHYLEKPITGSCRGGTVIIYNSDAAAGSAYYVKGWLTGERTMAIASVISMPGVEVSTYCIYSKDAGAADRITDEPIDLSGSWSCISDTVYTPDGPSAQALVGGLSIIQTGRVVSGVMDDERASTDLLALAGANTVRGPQDDSDYLGGLMYDTEGRYWSMEYQGGELILVHNGSSTDGVFSSEMRIYARGAQAAVIPAASLDLVGKQLVCQEVERQTGSATTTDAEVRDLTFTAQYGCLAFGILQTDGRAYDVIAYLRTSELAQAVCTINYGAEAAVPNMTYIIFTKDVKEAFMVEPWGRITQNTVLENYDADDTHDYVHHWYVGQVEGYDATGAYRAYSTDSAERNIFHLDIFRMNGNTFCGEYRDQTIAGIIKGDQIYFDVTVGGIFHHVEGKLRNSASLNLCDICYDSSGAVEVWNAYLGIHYLDYSNLQPTSTLDFVGDWTAYAAHAYNGTIDLALSGKGLTVTEKNGNVFRGTLDQVVGESTVSVSFSGCVVNNAGDSEEEGFIMDQNGLIWFFEVDRTGLQLYLCESSDVAALGTGLISDYRFYSRDGTGAEPVPAFQLGGTTWLLKDHTIITSAGTYTEGGAAAVTITFTSQSGILFCGNFADEGRTIRVAGYLDGQVINLIAQSDGAVGRADNYSYGELVNDHTLRLISFVTTSAGLVIATDSTFVLSTYDGALDEG